MHLLWFYLFSYFQLVLVIYLKFIQAKNFAEKGFNKNKEIRVCTADVMLSNGEEEEVTYNLYWQNKKKTMFMLEIVDY